MESAVLLFISETINKPPIWFTPIIKVSCRLWYGWTKDPLPWMWGMSLINLFLCLTNQNSGGNEGADYCSILSVRRIFSFT